MKFPGGVIPHKLRHQAALLLGLFPAYASLLFWGHCTPLVHEFLIGLDIYIPCLLQLILQSLNQHAQKQVLSSCLGFAPEGNSNLASCLTQNKPSLKTEPRWWKTMPAVFPIWTNCFVPRTMAMNPTYLMSGHVESGYRGNWALGFYLRFFELLSLGNNNVNNHAFKK